MTMAIRSPEKWRDGLTFVVILLQQMTNEVLAARLKVVYLSGEIGQWVVAKV